MDNCYEGEFEYKVTFLPGYSVVGGGRGELMEGKGWGSGEWL